jgi:hypothetical protein
MVLVEIKAVVDRIENGYAILKSEDFEMEISIPADSSEKKYFKGENVTLSFNAINENNG